MSYEPTLVIKKSDLDKHSQELEESWKWKEGSEEQRVMEYLKEVYEKHDVVNIDGLELILCSPDLSTFNEAVRDKLKEWDVVYGISN